MNDPDDRIPHEDPHQNSRPELALPTDRAVVFPVPDHGAESGMIVKPGVKLFRSFAEAEGRQEYEGSRRQEK